MSRSLTTDINSLVEVVPSSHSLNSQAPANLSVQNQALVISDDFKSRLKNTLAKNARLVDKQIEIKRIIFDTTNVFELFYLLDNYHADFAHHGLLAVFTKLNILATSEDNHDNQRIRLHVPSKIKTRLTKLLIKLAPNFEAKETCGVFMRLASLGFGLNDFAYQAVMQVLKYQTNQLDLHNLIKIKSHLFQMRDSADQVPANEYVQNLDKAVCLTVEVKIDEVKNTTEAKQLLKHFGKNLSENNEKRLEKYLDEEYARINKRQRLDFQRILKHHNAEKSTSEQAVSS